jgi:hypothetical protein
MSDESTAALPASLIIELFGGVRPLAKKLDMAASTVQGWKLRNHIPDNYHSRLRELLDPAAQDQFDQIVAGDVFSGSSDMPMAEIGMMPASTPVHSHSAAPVKTNIKSAALKNPPRDPNAHYFAMPQAHLRYWIMSSLATIGLISFVILILILVFFGQDIFDGLKTKALPNAITQSQTTPDLSADMQQLEESRAALEKTLDQVKKIKTDTPAGQANLVKDITQIEEMMTTLRGRIDTLDKQLQDKGVDAKAISAQIEQINRRDVAAAALLLGMAQIHHMLDRQASFANDLALLKALLGNEPAMNKSLDKLAPFAEKGLMTKDQINETLELVGTQSATLSQTHPDLSWWERIRLALSNVIQIRQTESVTPTTLTSTTANPQTPDAQIREAQILLQSDQFAQAAQILQDYKGPQADMVLNAAYNMQGREAALEVFNGLMEKSQTLLNIDQLKNQLLQQGTAPATELY